MRKKKMSRTKKIVLWVLCSVLVILIAGAGIGLKIGYGMLNAQGTVRETLSSQNTAVNADDPVIYISHRGLNAVAPENTIPAVEEAGKAGYYGVEVDIDRTKDGKWVIMHDNYVFRMLDAFTTKKIADYTYEELMQLTIDNGANIEKYPNLKIPLLSEVLDVCQKYNMAPCIEFKSESMENAQDVIDMLRERGLEAKATILCFDLEHLKEVRRMSGEVKTWYLVHEITDQAIADAKALGGKTGLDFNGKKRDANTPEMIRKIIDAGIEPGAWTIDSMDDVNYLYENGVRYITTNVILPK